MSDKIDRINARRLLTYIRSKLQKSFDLMKPGWDPEEAHRIISQAIEENFPEDYGFKVNTPTLEKLVALRLMGQDLKSTLHLDVEFTPSSPAEFVHVNLVIPDKT